MKETAMSNNGESPRLDRIEKIVEVIANMQRDMAQELLLRAQVALADEMQQKRKEAELKFPAPTEKTELKLQALAASEQRRDAALKALMRTVDQFLRKS
jgi:hypothetical protein